MAGMPCDAGASRNPPCSNLGIVKLGTKPPKANPAATAAFLFETGALTPIPIGSPVLISI